MFKFFIIFLLKNLIIITKQDDILNETNLKVPTIETPTNNVEISDNKICLDMEISSCINYDFLGNLTNIFKEKNENEESIQKICDHLGYSLTCLKLNSKILCNGETFDKTIQSINIILDPLLKTHETICKKLSKNEITEIYLGRKCFNLPDIYKCFSKYYGNLNYFLNQNMNHKFCNQMFEAFSSCSDECLKKCKKTTINSINLIIRNIFADYEGCSKIIPKIANQFPVFDSYSNSLSNKLDENILISTLILISFYSIKVIKGKL